MRILSILFVAVLILASCNASDSSKLPSKKNWKTVDLKYAKNFALKQSGNTFLLELYEPGTQSVNQTIEIDPAKNKRIISLAATLNGMICILNERDRVVGISSKDQVYDGRILHQIAQGQIKEFGDITQLSVEKIVSHEANLILFDMVQDQFPNKEKLKKLGVEVLPIYDWREDHPLAKAEWIKVVGAITGKYDQAVFYFDEVESNYLKLKEKTDGMGRKPTVMCGNLWQDIWYMPSGDNYFARLIQDAGGAYRYADKRGTVSLALSLEQVLKDNVATEYWINPGAPAKSQVLVINPQAKLLGSWKDHVYCYSKENSKFWEQSAARPDAVLEDLIAIFHPELIPGGPQNFYSKIKE